MSKADQQGLQALGKAVQGGITVRIENEPLTDVQKQWLDKIGFFQAEVIESQPTEWHNMEHKQFQWYDLPKEEQSRPIIQSDQSDEKISVLQH